MGKRELPVHYFFCYKFIEKEIPVNTPDGDFVCTHVYRVIIHGTDMFNIDDIGFVVVAGRQSHCFPAAEFLFLCRAAPAGCKMDTGALHCKERPGNLQLLWCA